MQNDPVNFIDPSGLEDEPPGDESEPGDVISVFTWESLFGGGGGGNSLLDRADLNREPMNKAYFQAVLRERRRQKPKKAKFDLNKFNDCLDLWDVSLLAADDGRGRSTPGS